ncbi:unnamed protein product [Miscanthus lutarioriparius]|uniref:DUF7851 domain-containing protein n=1 Tax=Miscanthus lutarioriparius TaxID=422564 RepID=A0A811RS66_9POAL|nr:unnamed protein product [Miscanthus lutarioriparius]
MTGPAGRRPRSPSPVAPPRPRRGTLDMHFVPCADVKGLRFGAQLIMRARTVRRTTLLELPHLLHATPSPTPSPTGAGNATTDALSLAPTTTAYIPTNFAILSHHAWHTLTLGLGTKNSKAAVFVFESADMKATVDAAWLGVVPLGDVGRRLIRTAPGNPEMARFKFCKGTSHALTSQLLTMSSPHSSSPSAAAGSYCTDADAARSAEFELPLEQEMKACRRCTGR